MNTAAQDTASPGPTATAPSEAIPTKKPTKKRIRNFTADDRAAHRIFEKGRREAFKERLVELAAQLPALADNDPQRLSKHVVVDESIARHKLLENRCVDALRGIQALMQERDELLAEVNNWRSNAGGSLRQPRRVVNVDGLVETEKDTRRRASAARLGQMTRRSSDRASGVPEEQAQAGAATSNQSDDSSHVPRVLPTEPNQDARAVSQLDGLLLDASWPQTGQPPPARFAPEPGVERLAMPDQGTSMQNNTLPDSTAGMADYQLLSDINTQQQMAYQNMNSMDFSTSDSASFDASHMSMSSTYLSSTGLNQGVPFQQHQQWVSWPG